MSKINNKSIILGLKILSILAFSVLIIPVSASAGRPGYVTPYGDPNDDEEIVVNNPRPIINSISPSSSNIGVGTKTITINGSGFIPSSMARINGNDRSTTFIDSFHLLVQTNATDLSRVGGFYITVWNRAPEGGLSNAVFFTTKTATVPVANTNGNNVNNNYSDTFSETIQPENNTNTTDNNSYSDLASNVVFGSNSLLPSGLIQWVLFAIVILLIVIIVRKIFGGKENYDAAPMKHA